ncbi:MAG: acetoin utilization protein AcuC [Chloroflexi bacterium]|nr:acetoin utilization protein AcuC [Chloroflexota bacterium]MCI0581217.1 acetoin utilization protein AcuC [Chloroflexota bacterium]MCI0644076.1 acetoin utilization protein AcuC [Chloroflexota bacterium]MCI0727892.1 acetoin utilization protein AcuC [Chloroflexota bacterium]
MYNYAMTRQAVFLSSPELWERGHGPDHPLKPERLQRTHELLEEYGAFTTPNVRLVAPRPATDEELALFHKEEYIDAVHRLSEGDPTVPARRYGFGPGDNPVFAGMYDSERLKAGAALQAAELLVNEECDVAFSYSGGLHHAGPDFASGFCIFGDIAVAIHWLLRQGLRVAYVDIDVHHGDGVQNAFYDTDQVLTISLHQDPRSLFPGTGYVHEIGAGRGQGYSVNVPLPPYTGEDSYLWAFRQVVPPLLERFAADVVVTQLGVDTHVRDPLASLALTTAGHEALFQALAELGPSWLALGGGGYDISVVPRSWTLAFGVMAGQTFPEDLPPGYQARYGGRTLRDDEIIRLERLPPSWLHAQVEKVVAVVKEQLKL